ncbi:DUF5340 domain-containing protein [Microcoleus sp. FACHB-672]|uniref:DUF5340 domain-containing protein n=1 Tax=Microcoleus sp. FACHB-672 TaxID=2692825 RepID=UPI001682099B|nr:DUF5340 domain-containing protein [Microcoleus sp. FACHB-672]MBD2041933.1 DUF5340 domain-containing protein [Microcoleus sp. FACHB-672]
MEPIPLPSHIHYELLLQLLERQTMFAVGQKPSQREQVHQLISTLRKALAQQKQLEDSCERANVPIEYRWSLNDNNGEQASTQNFRKAQQQPPA